MLSQNTELKPALTSKLPVLSMLPPTDRSSAALEIRSGVMKATDAPLAKNQEPALTEKALPKKSTFIVPEIEYKMKIAGYGIGATLLSGVAVLVGAGVSYGIAHSSALNWPLVATTAMALSYGIAKTAKGFISSINSWFRDRNSPEMSLDRKITREVKDQLKEGSGFISRLYYENPVIAPIVGTALTMAGLYIYGKGFSDLINNNELMQLVTHVLSFAPLFSFAFGQFPGAKIEQTKEQLHPELYRQYRKN